MPARITPVQGDGSIIKSLEQVDTGAIPKILVEQTVDLFHKTGGLPETIAAIAGLPGEVAPSGMSGEIIPGDTQAQFQENTIEGCTGVSRRATLAVISRARDKGANDGPLFVGQIHVFEAVILSRYTMECCWNYSVLTSRSKCLPRWNYSRKTSPRTPLCGASRARA
jgi:hypothetical protein